MQSKNIVNVAIGTSSLKVIHCEKRDTDIIVKNSAILETGSSMYLNKDTLNIDFIKDKLRIFFRENKIKGGKICYTLPDYIVNTRMVHKNQLMSPDYISGLIRTKQLHELLDENIENEEQYTFDCQVIRERRFGTKDDNDGETTLIVTYLPTEIVKSLKKMSKNLGMKGVVLESELSGYLRLINMFEVKDSYFMLDIGEIYTKVIFVSDTETFEYKDFSFGVYTIDGLISKIYGCSRIEAYERRMFMGINNDESGKGTILQEIVKDVFAIPVLEQLSAVENTYGNLSYVKRFLVTGGAWGIGGFKELIESQTLGLYGDECCFEDFSDSVEHLVDFDNEIVKSDVMCNIPSYSSCLGLVLRGGF